MNSNNIETKIKYIENAIEILLKDTTIRDDEKTSSLKVMEKRKTSLCKQLNLILSFPPPPPNLIVNICDNENTPIQAHKNKDNLELNVTHYIENEIIDTSIRNTITNKIN
jgi:hypothetical protein